MQVPIYFIGISSSFVTLLLCVCNNVFWLKVFDVQYIQGLPSFLNSNFSLFLFVSLFVLPLVVFIFSIYNDLNIILHYQTQHARCVRGHAGQDTVRRRSRFIQTPPVYPSWDDN